MKTKSLTAILAILAVAVCVCIFTACKNNGTSSSGDNTEEPPEVLGPYDTPTGFDKKKTGDTYGVLTAKEYYSNTTGGNRKCNVYTPPNYNPDVTYPVMYLLHGIGGNQNEWKSGNPNEILSNLINAGQAKPMIVVIPNIRAMPLPDSSSPGGDMSAENIAAFNNFINDLRDDLMPYIEGEYKVSNERNGRAISGLSMGGMESIYISVSMPETFGFIGAFSAAPTLETLLQPAEVTFPDEYKDNTFIMICCAKDDGIAISSSRNYNKYFTDNGVPTTYYELETGGHSFTVWKNGLYNFAKRIF